MTVDPDSPATFGIRRRATDALIARVLGEDEIRANICHEMLTDRLLTEDDETENVRRVDEVFSRAEYWAKSSAHQRRR